MSIATPTAYSLMILSALQKKSLDNVYLGSVPQGVKRKRRAAGKVAKVSRRANRGR